MSNPFKIGDSVECVESGDFKSLITVGQVYKVYKVSQEYIHVKDSYGKLSGFSYNRFTRHEPIKKENTMQQSTPEQHVKEFLKKLEYVLVNDNTVASSLGFTRHIHYGDPSLFLGSNISDIKGVDDIYTYINNSYDQLTSQAAQKRKLELLDKKAALDVELAEINKELEGL